MPLREFDRVRERLEVRVERRHLGWIVLLVVFILGGTFVGGWWLASRGHRAATSRPAPVLAANWVATKRLPSPPLRSMRTRAAPLVPRVASRRKARMAPLYELRPQRRSVALATARDIGAHAVAAAQREHGPELESLEATDSKAKRVNLGVKARAIVEALGDRPVLEMPAEWVQTQAPRPDALSHTTNAERSWALEISVSSWRDADGAALATDHAAVGETIAPSYRSKEVLTPQKQRAYLAYLAAEKARKEAEARAKREAEERARRAAEARAKAEAEARARALAEARARAKAEAEARARALAEAAARAKAVAQARARAEAAAKAAERGRQRAQAQAEARARAAAKARAAEQARAQRLAKLAEARKLRAAAETAKRERTRLAQLKKLPSPHIKAAARATDASKRSYWVQLKSLKDAVEARAFADQMRSKGYRVRIFAAKVTGLGAVHRIRVGPFPSLAATRNAASRISTREGFEVIPITVNR